MADREPVRWVTVKGAHIPIYLDEHGDEVFGVGTPIPQSRKEMMDMFIPQTDFIRSEGVVDLETERGQLLDKQEELRARRKELSEQLESESSVKPKKDWTDDEELMYEIGFGKPRTYTERGWQLKAEYDKVFAEGQQIDHRITDINDQLERLRSSQHFKEVTRWEADMRITQGGTYNFKAGDANKSYIGFQTKTGISDYDRPDAPGRIVEMSPREYLERITYQSFRSTWGRVLRSTDYKKVVKYAEMMIQGSKAPMPSMTIGEEKQEGRHRAMAAALLQIPKIPVYIEFAKRR